jgi:hypothetical protein
MTIGGSTAISGILAEEFDSTYQNAFKEGILEAASIKRGTVTINSITNAPGRRLQEAVRKLVTSIEIDYSLAFVVEDQEGMTVESAAASVETSIGASVSSNQLTTLINNKVVQTLGVAVLPISVDGVTLLGSVVDVQTQFDPSGAPTAAPGDASASTPLWMYGAVGWVGLVTLGLFAYWVKSSRERSKVYVTEEVMV